MSLYERLLHYTETGEPLPMDVVAIPPHAFIGYLAERARGTVTNAQVIAAFSLDSAEQAELVTLVGRFTGGFLTRTEFADILYAGAARLPPFDTVAAVKTRLGV